MSYPAVPRPASVDQVAAHGGMGSLPLLSGAVGNCSDRRRGYRPVHLVKGGLYGSCPGLRFVPASHLVTPSREAHRPRLATYWALPEARTTSRPAAARRVAVASGDRTVKKATAVMTAQPGRCPSPKRRPTVRLAREHPRPAAKTLSLVGGRATAVFRQAALHGHTGFARRTGSGRQSWTCEASSVVVRSGTTPLGGRSGDAGHRLRESPRSCPPRGARRA